ncbi:putative hydrophobic protein (TIGR00271 family) [Pedobacter sp. UYP30]|uniref:TIGR00341 family protein n=1 Tax=Pedobacter sp. UYP30 TaxID=1756400 RepID=UPI003396618B
MREIFIAIKRFISYRFNLHEDSADESETIKSIVKNVEFRGAHLWTLIFAIFIASIGLNVNSTAVIIGAMLISPLMGPIMGVGLGIGINDFELVKKAARNLALATAIGIGASALYFFITPLHEASSEILSRTSPSIWDVFIASFGGLAGIVAATRKEKTSTVIPGVAIATALMPPLCTAGYGLAMGNVYFVLGALYLYFINSIFICVATYLIIRFMKFRKKHFEDKAYERQVKHYILIVVVVTIVPSIFLAGRIVNKSLFENNARAFIKTELHYANSQVISKTFKYNHGANEIDLLLIGKLLDQNQLDSLKRKLPKYDLAHTKLIIRQGLDAKNNLDLSQIKASIIEAVSGDSLNINKNPSANASEPIPDLTKELKALYPDLVNFSINQAYIKYLDTNKIDSITMAVVALPGPMYQLERNKLRTWLKDRLDVDSVRLIVTRSRK